jgi:hypothetical protein
MSSIHALYGLPEAGNNKTGVSQNKHHCRTSLVVFHKVTILREGHSKDSMVAQFRESLTVFEAKSHPEEWMECMAFK